MSIQSNSVRLQRLAKTMDLRSNKSSSFIETSPQMVKLPTLRSINKSIKYGDLSFTTTRDMNKLRKEPDYPNNVEEMSAHQNLIVIRKRFDNTNKNRQELQATVDSFQKERDHLQQEQNRFETQKKQGIKSVTTLQSNLKFTKVQLEESQIEKKIIQNMMSRLKQDKIVYDLRKYNMQKELTHIHKQKEVVVKDHKKHQDYDQNTEKVKIKLLNHLEVEKKERDSHVQSVQELITQKMQNVAECEARKLDLQETALNTLQDKDQKEKNWYKVYLCHRFVARLLRDKMNREMSKFNTVEVAFKNIKTATGTNNADILVKKFLNKESAYGDLLGKIAQDERIIMNVKTQGEELRKEKRKLELKQEQLNSNKIQAKDLSREEKQLKVMSDRSLLSNTYLERLESWLTRNLKKFDNPSERNNHPQAQQACTLVRNEFKTYLQTLNKNLDELQKCEDKSPLMQEVTNEKNVRVKLSQLDNVQEKERKLSYQNIDNQDEYINGQRIDVIKNNEKFMKDLRKKYEDIKKAQIQDEPKKKEVLVEKIKPPPVELES